MPTLNWIGKEAVVEHHRHVPLRLLECDRDLSAGDPDAGNLLVQGDNLEALKALLPRYKGQVKCVYIDPPYNTGNEGWVYNDNVNDPRIKKWLGEVVGKEAEDLCRHDKWLCMMYPRLVLLRELLRGDGIIFVSIDENEVSYLRLILEEVFGASNFVGSLIWRNVTDNNPTNISSEHEYVWCFARNKRLLPPVWKSLALPVKDRLISFADELRTKFPNIEERQAFYTKWFRQHKEEMWPFDRYKYIDDGGIFTGSQSVHNPGKEGYRYDVPHERTGRPCKIPLMGYRFPPETMQALLNAKRIIFGDDETKIIEIKLYVQDYKAKLASVIEMDTRLGANEVRAMFPDEKRIFGFSKPSAFLTEFLSFVLNKDDTILDSFAGSGTTGHAVCQLNKADGGHRKFILVEIDERIARTVTSQRLKKLIEGYKNTNAEAIDGFGGGFRFCRLGRTLFDKQGEINPDVPFADLARYVYVIATGVPITSRPRKDSPMLGVHEGRAVYLLYNGILGDRRPAGGNVLTHAMLQALPPHPNGPDEPRVIYGEACRLGESTLQRLNIVFRQTPYSLREG